MGATLSRSLYTDFASTKTEKKKNKKKKKRAFHSIGRMRKNYVFFFARTCLDRATTKHSLFPSTALAILNSKIDSSHWASHPRSAFQFSTSHMGNSKCDINLQFHRISSSTYGEGVHIKHTLLLQIYIAYRLAVSAHTPTVIQLKAIVRTNASVVCVRHIEHKVKSSWEKKHRKTFNTAEFWTFSTEGEVICHEWMNYM